MYHHAGLEQKVVYSLSDICCMGKIMVGVFVFTVAHFQSLYK